jgi:hypothetical protein
VALAYIPTIWEAENRRIVVQEQPQKKLVKPHLKNKLGVVVHACDSSYSGGRGRRILV